LAKILDVDVRYFFDGLAEIAPPVAAGVGKTLENERPGL
jgi:hypothetical protein